MAKKICTDLVHNKKMADGYKQKVPRNACLYSRPTKMGLYKSRFAEPRQKYVLFFT